MGVDYGSGLLISSRIRTISGELVGLVVSHKWLPNWYTVRHIRDAGDWSCAMTTVEALAVKLQTLPPELLEDVETFVEFLLHKQQQQPLSVLDVLAEPSEEHAFHTPEEVRAYLQAERDSWDR